MLYKAIGATIVTLSATALGINSAIKYAERVKNLETLAKHVEFIESEISFSAPILSDAMYKASTFEQSIIGDIFADAAVSLKNKNGKTFAEIWKKSVAKHASGLFDKDMPLILSFADCANKGDVEVQTKALREYIKRINTTIEDIKPLCRKNAHLSRSLGIYAGLLISVLLL